MSRVKKISTPFLIFIFLLLFISGYIFLRIWIYAPYDNTLSYKNNTGNVLTLNIPGDLEFCGERIPKDNIKAKKAIEREFYSDSYWKLFSTTLFKKTIRWFPIIEPILKSENIPNDFKYVAVIESHLSNAVSPAGAAGFWQLGESTAYLHGLEVNDFIDERYHVEKATKAACKNIKEAFSYFKNWTLTAAAYNCGIGVIQNVLKKQKKKSYYDLELNHETGSFVYRVLAYKTLLSNPSHFGIEINKKNLRQNLQFKTFKIDSSITNLEHFAKHIKSTVSLIKDFNPWLLRDIIINPERKRYDIKIPKKNSEEFKEYLADINNKSNQTSSEDSEIEDSKLNQDTTLKNLTVIQYEVKLNEPLKNLADFFKVNEDDIKKWNNISSEIATKGQTLVIYK